MLGTSFSPMPHLSPSMFLGLQVVALHLQQPYTTVCPHTGDFPVLLVTEYLIA
jgi:hypothetical protein